MTKRGVSIAAAILVLAIVAGTGSLAKGPNPACPIGGAQITGQIVSVDYGAHTLAVNTGSATITVVATASTVIKMANSQLGFDALKAGMTISACGTLDGSTLTANVITVKYRGK